MSDFFNIIKGRKSIRNYSSQAVKEEDIKEIVNAAILAPNSMNQQKWHFTAVTDRKMLKKMNDACCAAMAQSSTQTFNDQALDSDYNAFYHAPAVIVVSSGKAAYAAFDAGAAAQTICLGARALGYETCVTTSTGLMLEADPGLKKELHIPDDYAFTCAIVLGKGDYNVNEQFRERNKDAVSFILEEKQDEECILKSMERTRK